MRCDPSLAVATQQRLNDVAGEILVGRYDSGLADAQRDVAAEYLRARGVLKAAPFNSAHEGWAVLYEEVDELWDVVKVNPKKYAGGRQAWLAEMRKEAVQVAAMALAFIKEVCDSELAPAGAEGEQDGRS